MTTAAPPPPRRPLADKESADQRPPATGRNRTAPIHFAATPLLQ